MVVFGTGFNSISKKVYAMRHRNCYFVSQMFEDTHLGGTPPGSPLMFHDDSKFSNVAWCADYLQVLGSEKTHKFKVRHLKTWVFPLSLFFDPSLTHYFRYN